MNTAGTHTSRRVNALAQAIGAETYLEIGVAEGKTFFAVDMPNKVAVDPKFRFDVGSLPLGSGDFYEVTSDEFFTTFPNAKKFDIIFLDGLHTFEQTFRDFCSSLSFSHDKTVWVIDDVFPNDIYSAWPNQREAVAARHAAGGKSGQWHGDVFKLVVAIHEFFPTLSFMTFEERNQQTIVWRQPRPSFRPANRSLESISRLGYFDFLGLKSLFDLRSEDEIIGHVASRING